MRLRLALDNACDSRARISRAAPPLRTTLAKASQPHPGASPRNSRFSALSLPLKACRCRRSRFSGVFVHSSSHSGPISRFSGVLRGSGAACRCMGAGDGLPPAAVVRSSRATPARRRGQPCVAVIYPAAGRRSAGGRTLRPKAPDFRHSRRSSQLADAKSPGFRESLCIRVHARGGSPVFRKFCGVPLAACRCGALETGCPPRRSCVRRERRPPAAGDNPASR